MDYNNLYSQSSQLINPTQQSEHPSSSQATLHPIQALIDRDVDDDVIADGYGDSDGLSGDSEHETEDDENEEQRQQYHLQIQESTWHPSWTAAPIPDNSLLGFGLDDDEVEPFIAGGEFCVGQVFSNKKELQDAVKQYSIARNQTFVVRESKSDKYIVECKKKPDTDCPWRVRAVKQYPQSDEFTIVRYPGPHRCSGQLGSMVHSNLTSDYISGAIVELVRADPKLSVKAIIQIAMQNWGYEISYKKAWTAKQKAVAKIYGDWEESYHLLQRWLVEMQKANPGSVVQWMTKPTNNPGVVVFQRVFWSFRACIQGFAFCRPLITVDATHLYGRYKGCLLVAMAVDANNQLFPLAFAVVESENNSSWGWEACLRHFVVRRDGICVISDRHKGILNGMKNDCPDWIHRYCIRHLGSNVGKHYGSKFRTQFKKLAKQRQQKKFERDWQRLKGDCEGIDKYLTEEAGPIECWSIHLDGGHRYGVVSSNLAEVYNSLMKDIRMLPIAALVQFTFFKTNSWFVHRFEKAQHSVMNGDDYPPNIQAMINKNLLKAGYHKLRLFDRGNGVYSITTKRGTREAGKGGKVQLVHLRNSECSCSKWQIYHLPCSHVLCVCRKQNLGVDQFVDQIFKTQNHYSTYSKAFRPIADEAYWSQFSGPTCVADQNMIRGKGRPKSTRYKNEMDEPQGNSSTRQRCSLCGQCGHNKRKCPSRAGSSA